MDSRNTDPVNEEKEYLFLFNSINREAARAATEYLRDIGIRVLAQHGQVAAEGEATEDQVEAARKCGLFTAVVHGQISDTYLEKLPEEQRVAVDVWNHRHSEEFREATEDLSNVGRSWGDGQLDSPGPYALYTPEEFKEELEEAGLVDDDKQENERHDENDGNRPNIDYETIGKDDLLEAFDFDRKDVIDEIGIDEERFEELSSRDLVDRLDLSRDDLRQYFDIDRRPPKEHDEVPKYLDGDEFVEFERELLDIYQDETVAYHLARIAWHLDPRYHDIVVDLPEDFIDRLFREPPCWEMVGENSVGLVFVESSRRGGPTFSTREQFQLLGLIIGGLNWLAREAPSQANLTWVYDWQFVEIDVADGTNSSDEAYWRNPAMGEVNYDGNTYSEDWSGIKDYREDMRLDNFSQHAFVIFVTPYSNDWHAYAGGGRLTLADRNNWGGWGINDIDEITAHEVCHLYGAADEYTGSGTPCSSCGSTHGCDVIPNGNCGACASPQQDCVMDKNYRRLCEYTQGQIGWTDLFVELTTDEDLWAGTDDTVRLDIGDRTFEIDTPGHDDRERGNVEGYALHYTGVTEDQIKRVGIRKSPDSFAGGWNLDRVRLWCRGDLVCDENNIDRWLEDDQRWWVSDECGTSDDIVNTLRVRVSTSTSFWSGTDDDVGLSMGGRSWNLDNPWHNDFERGSTDTFDLDPGTSLYKSALSSVEIHKSPDGFAGGWKLKGVEITVNGSVIYNNQSINKWLEDGDRDWHDPI